MFPRSIEGYFPITRVDEAEARERLGRLEERLLTAAANDVRREGHAVTFRGGIFRFVGGWNLLMAVSYGRVEVDVEQSLVRYDLSCIQMLIIASLMAAALGLAASFHGGLTGVPIAVGAWLWLFGMSFLTTRWRLGRLLREVLGPERRSPAPTRF